MTRKEAKQTIFIKSRSYESAHQNYIHLLSLHKIIDDIFDDHEETTSELRAEVIHQTDKVERLKEQIKDKDELIKYLECIAYHAEGYINDLHSNSKEQQWH